MKEFIEKLIDRLEELQKLNYEAYETAHWNNDKIMYINASNAYANAITEINQLAEEYKDNVIINGQYCWQTCGATERCKECNRLCNGNIDYYENYDVLAEEHNGGWIPCTVVAHPKHCNDCEVTFKDVRGYGRDVAFYTDKWRRASDEVPILVVAWKEPSAPYQPKGE